MAGRVIAHLKRWDVIADDTAGRPLPQTAAGRVLLLLAEVAADDAAPVPLLALLTHPLIGAGEGRAAWLDNARALEYAQRAHVHLQARPGEDPTILSGLIHIIIQEKLVDEPFVQANAQGLEALKVFAQDGVILVALVALDDGHDAVG